MSKTQTIAEKLGLPKETKFLTIHADDMGVAHSENRASFEAYQKKGINSGSVMVPCPWFAEAADWSVKNPDFDMGVHLTFTAEWKHYKWGSVAPANEVPSLLNEKGYFYRSVNEVVEHAKPAEFEKEMRAQIDRAIAFGIRPTHLDGHMACVFRTPEFFGIYLKIGREYGIPCLIPMNILKDAPEQLKLIEENDILTDALWLADTPIGDDEWPATYEGFIKNLRPGLNSILVHTAFNDAEMQAVSVEHPHFGAAWRQRDFDILTDPEFLKLQEKEGVVRITWREIKALYNKVTN